MKHKMHLIKNPNIKGKIYVEDFDTREEEDRIKFYDSNYKYIDYLPLDANDKNLGKTYNHFIKMVSTKKSIAELLDYFACNYELIGTKNNVDKYFHDELNFDDEYDSANNEWVIRIGDTYIVLSEN